jgi:hypothetical protein
MGGDDIYSVLRREYAALAAGDRKRKIRELVAESKTFETFIREHFSEFYAEAFPASSSKNAPRRKAQKARPVGRGKRR